MKNKSLELQPGKSYQMPKHWGDDIQVGDIFRVTIEYIESHPGTTCLEGDYYISLKEPVAQETYPEFPRWGENNEFFKHAWTSFSELKILLSDKSSSGALYANDLNQLAITVLYRPIGSMEGHGVIPLSPAVEKAVSFSLINYDTGEELPHGWTVTTKQGEFVSSPIATSSLQTPEVINDDGPYTYRRVLYISCQPDTTPSDLSLGISLMLPGGDSFTEWRESHSFNVSVHIKALPRISYTEENVVLDKIDREIPNYYTNYYFRPKDARYNFVKSVKREGLINDKDKEGIFGYKCHYWGNCRHIYYWDITNGKEIRTQLGIDPYVTATINDIFGSLTFTRTWQQDWYSKDAQKSLHCIFQVFDQYGNSGLFKNKDSSGLWGNDGSIDPYWYDLHIVSA
ncbi:hypothetical protein FKD06_11345 [Serratia sp. SRS-8-S-2018]|uniref:hypothetical protein n=1 Tax=Serratia sp. SRS-8-S-2018 TaxID=2591107 RepID=UPI00113FE389|nr:hypothetical protein [Serratia sp. SRS-8-S-2018]TPW51403.1 hypothetical protein FKD06_11345 [Serratia sp. SRS-8-S-2018]